ncbi:NAD(P)-dependent oxidoreductase [Hyphococcus flavus]|uniref:NAD(P)-dependent oxidoreductase n=1 Tax=Hyphococcus flavus TaxID=1866326 RepID=A0AAF0CEH5_9PROT|nr:NAD(P)-dependent oxidoreductase [Hyphococcus flavus]WDI31271.1 NAD(P)-dependent oxidoreductase [Hyphococcus flavus]
MKILVTGSSGHLGEALMRLLRSTAHDAIGLDIKPGPYTALAGSITDADFANAHVRDVDAVIHTATLHKPHVATHSRQDFVDVNITGTLNLLEAAREHGAGAFIFTSTTSAFGHVLRPEEGAPAAWVTEELRPKPKNIYGITKLAAEHLCSLFHEKYALNTLILRTSRFFPEEDDSRAIRDGYDDLNAKVNELLYRRVDIEDAANAHLCALKRAGDIGFGRYIISATAPFSEDDAAQLRADAPSVVRRHVAFDEEFERRGWKMFPSLDRVYVNEAARRDLGWSPKVDFKTALARLSSGENPFSDLMNDIGKKGYHDQVFEDGPFPVD